MIYKDINSLILREAFPLFQKMMMNHFNLDINDFVECIDTVQYQSIGEYKIDIFSIPNNYVEFQCVDIFYIEDGILYSKFKHPVIDIIVMDINRSLHVLEALRLSDANKKIIFTAIDNMQPVLMFSYNALDLDDAYEPLIKILFNPVLPRELEESFYFMTNSFFVQHAHEYCGIKIFYNLDGTICHSDLEVYDNRIANVWNFENSNDDVDYKRLGELTDMLLI